MTAVPGGQQRPTKPRTSWIVHASAIVLLALTWWSGSERYGIGFSLSEVIGRVAAAGAIVGDFFPPDWSFASRTVGPFIETVQMAVLGGVIGCALALIAAFLASRVTAPNTATYLADKGLLSVIRSIPDVLYALVFVIGIGIGPLAGIFALIFFNIGVVAKLLSETVDGVDLGPVEAAHATGAGRFKAVRTAVFPQVLPNYLAYSLYTFELNLRASTVLGIVGAGGIGQLVNIVRADFRYDALAVIIVEIFVIVFIVEFISIALRRRLV